MKKVVFTLSIAVFALVMVSCSTDAYDLPSEDELRNQNFETQFYINLHDDENSDYEESIIAAKDDDGDSSNSTDNTGTIVTGTKKD